MSPKPRSAANRFHLRQKPKTMKVYIPEKTPGELRKNADNAITAKLPKGSRFGGKDCSGATIYIPDIVLQDNSDFAMTRTLDFSKCPSEDRRIAITLPNEDWWNSEDRAAAPSALREIYVNAADIRFRMYKTMAAASDNAMALRENPAYRKNGANFRKHPGAERKYKTAAPAQASKRKTVGTDPNASNRRTLSSIEKSYRKAAEILGGVRK